MKLTSLNIKLCFKRMFTWNFRYYLVILSANGKTDFPRLHKRLVVPLIGIQNN